MASETSSPARGGAAGLGNALSVGTDSIAINPAVAQAKIELIRDEICACTGPLILQLNAALAMADAQNDAGLLYALRCARAYWRAISANARDLAQVRSGLAAQAFFDGLPSAEGSQ